MKERIVWADYVKAVCIFFVVLLHAGVDDPLRSFVRVFVIPTFFFVSGMFFNPSKYVNVRVFFKQRLLKILIPYVCFNLLSYLFWIVIGKHFGADAETMISPLNPLFGILLGDYELLVHYRPLWFLACLITVEIICFFLLRGTKKTVKLIGVLCFTLIACLDGQFEFISLPWGVNIACAMIPFFVVGYYSKMNLHVLQDKKNSLVLAVVSLFSFVVVYYCSLQNTEVKVFIREYGNFALFLVGAFSGIVFMVSSVSLFAQYFPSFRFMLFIGKNTLYVLTLHLMMFSFVKGISLYLLNQSLSFYESQLGVWLMSVVSVLLLCPVIAFCNKYLPFLTGKNYEHIKK